MAQQRTSAAFEFWYQNLGQHLRPSSCEGDHIDALVKTYPHRTEGSKPKRLGPGCVSLVMDGHAKLAADIIPEAPLPSCVELLPEKAVVEGKSAAEGVSARWLLNLVFNPPRGSFVFTIFGNSDNFPKLFLSTASAITVLYPSIRGYPVTFRPPAIREWLGKAGDAKRFDAWRKAALLMASKATDPEKSEWVFDQLAGIFAEYPEVETLLDEMPAPETDDYATLIWVFNRISEGKATWPR